MDTNGVEESVIVSEVSSFQGLKCMQEWYLGLEKVSCLERCPQFRGVLIEREFHCIVHNVHTYGVYCTCCMYDNYVYSIYYSTISLCVPQFNVQQWLEEHSSNTAEKTKFLLQIWRGITLCGPKPSLEFEILLEVGKICSDHPVNF